MADVFTKAKRSDVMSRIRSRGNADTELALAKLLRAHGVTGWRRQACLKFQVSGSKFQVKPDFVFKEVRLAVFVDGCFWHGCPKHGTQPKGNASFWRKKLTANKRRDARVTRTLRRPGWRVIRIWEHELRQSGKRKVKSLKAGTSTPHPGPLPGRGGEAVRARGAGSGNLSVVRRVQRAIAGGAGK